MSKVFASPKARLAGRAALAGVVAFVSAIQAANGSYGGNVVKAAAVSGVWAAIEYFTPLNAAVGK